MDGAPNMHLTNEALGRRFDYHPPTTQDKVERHGAIRSVCLGAAVEIVGLTGPPTREQSTAITKLEEAMFWANAAIAREITAPEL